MRAYLYICMQSEVLGQHANIHTHTHIHRLLLEIVAKHGPRKWSVIAKEMGGTRTDSQCSKRYAQLKPEEEAKKSECVCVYICMFAYVCIHVQTASFRNDMYS
jgi:hypothetical protein